MTSNPLHTLWIVGTFLLCACGGPLGPIAGGKLSGEVHAEAVTSWDFAAAVVEAQFETQPSDPQSINIWIGVVDGDLYVPSSLILGEEDPAQRGWIQHVSKDPDVRIRIDGKVYPVTATRVTDPEIITQVKATMLAKYDEEPTAQTERAWVFALTSR